MNKTLYLLSVDVRIFDNKENQRKREHYEIGIYSTRKNAEKAKQMIKDDPETEDALLYGSWCDVDVEYEILELDLNKVYTLGINCLELKKPRRIDWHHLPEIPDPDLDSKWEIKMNTCRPEYEENFDRVLKLLDQTYVKITESNRNSGIISFVKYDAYNSLQGAGRRLRYMRKNRQILEIKKIFGKYGSDFN